MTDATLFGMDVAADAPVDDPLALLDRWLAPEALLGPADSTTRPLMALATVGADGWPRVRHVLLSSYDGDGLHFHSDSRSAKAAELAGDPRAAATIVWPDVPRQVSVVGSVVAESAAAQAAAYAERSRYLQVLAWVNDEALAQRPADERAAAWEAFDASHEVLEPPPTWTGWVLQPTRITFWRGGGDGPSQRLCCERQASGWTVRRQPG